MEESIRHAEKCVIFNPHAGKKRAGERFDRLRKEWDARVDFLPSESAGHSIELARQAALNGYRTVIAAGGDGTAHEVANGILQADRPEAEFAVVPIGSANDFAYSLDCHQASHPAAVHTIDVGKIRTLGNKDGDKEKFFICCLGLGFNGAVTMESRRIHRLQGVALYGLATLRALVNHYRCPTMEIVIDDRPPWKVPTFMFSILLGRREGGFVLAPNARLDDGLFDFVHASNLTRFEVLSFLPRLALFGLPAKHPKLTVGTCRTVRVQSPEPLTIHVDGEFFALPADGIHRVEIEIVPAALKVRSGMLGIV